LAALYLGPTPISMISDPNFYDIEVLPVDDQSREYSDRVTAILNQGWIGFWRPSNWYVSRSMISAEWPVP